MKQIQTLIAILLALIAFGCHKSTKDTEQDSGKDTSTEQDANTGADDDADVDVDADANTGTATRVVQISCFGASCTLLDNGAEAIWWIGNFANGSIKLRTGFLADKGSYFHAFRSPY